MARARLSPRDLRREIAEFHDRYPKLADDELFVLWFLRAFVTEGDTAAASALCGGSRDKGVDAVFIDDNARSVVIVQGKYRVEGSKKSEHRGDVIGFAQVGVLISGDNDGYGSLTKDMSPDVAQKLAEARKRITKMKYGLQMYFVTMGRCSANLYDEARRVVKSADAADAAFHLFDQRKILLLLSDYLDGVAPPVPSLDLEIESGGSVRTSGLFNRYDHTTDIESWVFAMTDVALAGLFERAGTRLFARNVRGFLGSSEINRGMQDTLEKEPEYFWYYNNGVTIVCDEATLESARGRELLRVTNPQVINGQQTTRTLARELGKRPRASVLVRVIRVPRDGDDDKFETLVSQIVQATNWQNAIRPSDLMSNDRRQIEIERQLRKLNYVYLRKRMTKGEARRAGAARHMRFVRKDELAQAVAACDLDPSIVRQGKERLFEERWYGQIFPNADPRYYLSRYGLMREVSAAARGYPERAYAKWLVLNFMWASLEPLCRARSRADAFRDAFERIDANLPIVNPLFRANNAAFIAALRFFRARRGKGRRASDVSTFFQRRNLHKEFARFWRSPANKSRRTFDVAWESFRKNLEQAAER